jgi:predicted negative regulator of RcsB-dependent stress response
MAYNNEEQESIDALKSFWNRYGTMLLSIITVVLLAVAGWRGWGWYQAEQTAQAGIVYDQMIKAVQDKDTAKVKEASGTLFEKYGSTAYGQMAALVGARYYIEVNDAKSAKPLLQWAADKAKLEEFRVAARVRLAGLLLDEKAYDEAAKLVAQDPSASYVPIVLDRRGDVFLAQGKTKEAQKAYSDALAKLDANSPMKPVLQLKLDGLGASAS